MSNKSKTHSMEGFVSVEVLALIAMGIMAAIPLVGLVITAILR